MAKSTVESSIETVLNVARTGIIKVLHVDDDQGFLKVAKQCLEMQGEFEADNASSVNEALEKLNKTEYDVVVSDYQMPSKDGLEFLKELRENGNTVPFIVFTGKGREEVAIKALNLGADQYIDKHGDPEAVYCELAHSIRVAVERKKAEEALSAERDKLETVTGNIGAGLAIISKDYHTLWANDVLKQIFGDVEGKICYSTYNQRNDICPECGVQEIFETEKAKVVHEQVGKDVDGKTIWSEITATPVKDRDGNITAVLELVVPITQRKMAEAELRSSAEKYGKLFDEAMDAIFVADAETGILIDCNRAASELVGREKSELIGKHQRILHPPEKTEEEFSTTFKQHLKEKEGRILETQVITKKGEIKDVAIKANVFELGNKRVVQGIFRDITEHAWVSSFPERNPNPILEVDLDGNTNYLNPAAQKLRSQLRGLKLSNAFEKELKTLVDEFKIHRKENFVRENVKIGDRHYQQSIYYFSEKSVLRLYMIDVTERKETEEQIKKVHKEFLRIFDVISDFVFVIDRDYRLVRVNKKVCETLKKKPEKLVGKRCYEVMHGTDKPWPNCPYRKTLETKEASSAEIDDPNIGMPLLVTISPIFDEIGEFVQCVHTAKDITERKKAEQTLKESEEKYRSLVELAPDGIVAVNTEGIVTSANRSFLTLVGYNSEEIVGKPFTEMKTSRVEDIPKFQEMFSSLVNGEPLSPVEFLYVRRDGTSRWAEVHPSLLVKDGNPVGAQVIMRDVSERKNAEKLIQENQQKFEQLFMSNPEAAVHVDPNERVLNVNPRFTELFGYSFDEIKEKFLDDFVVPEDRKKEALMLAQKGKEGYVYYETVRKNKKGSLIPVTLSTAPIKLQGQHLGDIVLYKDITERKKAEEERREAMEKVQMMNEKLRVVGGLTRHDVNNKLTAVAGYAYLARNKLPGNSEVLNYLKQIEASIEQTAQIFDFAKAYEMLGVEELAYVDVEKTVDEAVSLFPSLKDIKVMNDCHGLTVLADSLLKQLFYNLIDNSLKYGEKLSRIRVSYEDRNDHLNVIYEDDGVGIPQAAKPKLFHEGYTTGKGSGYGLYLIKRMMEAYGWTIQEAGTPGKGAQFTVTIPKTNPKGMENFRQSGLARTK